MLWFTADTHFGHKNIIEFCGRPFETIQEHDESLIARWNAVVAPEDTVYHLGDFAYKARANYVLHILQQLNGVITLVPGGHDFTKPNRIAWRKATGIEVRTRHQLINCEFDGVTYVLSHWPMSTWLGRRYGSRMLHGHCHSKTPEPEHFNDNVGRIDVGVDAWEYHPVSINQILDCPGLSLSDS